MRPIDGRTIGGIFLCLCQCLRTAIDHGSRHQTLVVAAVIGGRVLGTTAAAAVVVWAELIQLGFNEQIGCHCAAEVASAIQATMSNQ